MCILSWCLGKAGGGIDLAGKGCDGLTGCYGVDQPRWAGMGHHSNAADTIAIWNEDKGRGSRTHGVGGLRCLAESLRGLFFSSQLISCILVTRCCIFRPAAVAASVSAPISTSTSMSWILLQKEAVCNRHSHHHPVHRAHCDRSRVRSRSGQPQLKRYEVPMADEMPVMFLVRTPWW